MTSLKWHKITGMLLFSLWFWKRIMIIKDWYKSVFNFYSSLNADYWKTKACGFVIKICALVQMLFNLYTHTHTYTCTVSITAERVTLCMTLEHLSHSQRGEEHSTHRFQQSLDTAWNTFVISLSSSSSLQPGQQITLMLIFWNQSSSIQSRGVVHFHVSPFIKSYSYSWTSFTDWSDL